MNKLLGYFDLASNARGARGLAADARKFPVAWQYGAMLLGIVVQPFLSAYQETGQWQLASLTGWFAASILIGFAIFPGVYKSTLDPEKPLFVQCCLVFTAGMGWESLLMMATATATGAPQA